MNKIGDAISRVRNTLKAVEEDAFLTDRYIYSLILKYSKTLMYRDEKILNIFKNTSLFQEIPCMEMIEVDRIEACCLAVKTGCTFMRSKYELPKISDLNGPLIKTVTTMDYSQKAYRTEPAVYENMTKTSGFRYNRKKYYWIINNFLFIPDTNWERVRISAMWEDDITNNFCDVPNEKICMAQQDRNFNIPDYLFTEIESMVRQEIIPMYQIPSDGADDSQNMMR